MTKKFFSRVLPTIIVLVFAISIVIPFYFLFFRVSEVVSYDIEKWNELQNRYSFLPSVDDFGEYNKLNFKYCHREYSAFQSDIYTVRALYSDGNFANQKDYFEDKYLFQKTILDYGDKITEKETSFDFEGFYFQMLSVDEYDLYYPKRIVFLGISKEKQEIVFVLFEDIDLDCIESSYKEFLIKECGFDPSLESK